MNDCYLILRFFKKGDESNAVELVARKMAMTDALNLYKRNMRSVEKMKSFAAEAGYEIGLKPAGDHETSWPLRVAIYLSPSDNGVGRIYSEATYFQARKTDSWEAILPNGSKVTEQFDEGFLAGIEMAAQSLETKSSPLLGEFRARGDELRADAHGILERYHKLVERLSKPAGEEDK